MTFSPNPIWTREMRQATRLVRTPFVLAAITTLAGLSVCAAGGIASVAAPPAEVGSVLFQTFFSIAFAVVAWVGPGVAALSIVSERTGHTWESVILTGLSPAAMARGKFLASLTYIALYLAALAPVGALPFLFGGVTATEVVIAFALLGVFAVLAVGFGLAVSSGASTTAVALLVTLPLSSAVSLFTYFALGVGLSVALHDLWPVIAAGAPVWLPGAYVRVAMGRDYFVYLLAIPVALTAILAGFFHAVTVSNLSDPGDDRGFALKRWFLAAVAILCSLAILVVETSKTNRYLIALGALSLVFLLSLSTLFVLSLEPASPSRRMRALFLRTKRSAFERFLGPGVVKTAVLLELTTAAVSVVIAAAGIFAERHGVAGAPAHARAVAIVCGYGVCFFGFLCGFLVFTRSLRLRKIAPRVLIAVALVTAMFGPLFIGAISGVTWSTWDQSFAFAAATPFYVLAMLEFISSGLPDNAVVARGLVAMSLWALLGLVLGLAGRARLARQRARELDAERSFEALSSKGDGTSRSPAAPGPT